MEGRSWVYERRSARDGYDGGLTGLGWDSFFFELYYK